MTGDKTENIRVVSERINTILSDTTYDFSLKELNKIHFFLFDGLSGKAGKFRNKFNPRKKEDVLYGNSVKYTHDSDISQSLEELFKKEQNFNYINLTVKEKIIHISSFFSDLWRIHPFYDGNTRTLTLFVIKRMKQLGFPITNEPFELNAQYYRNALVRSAYETKNIPRDISFLKNFLTDIVNNKPLDNLSSESLKIEQRNLKSRTKYGKR